MMEPNKPVKPTCDTCPYWVQGLPSLEPDYGECRCESPGVIHAGYLSRATHPPTRYSHWCGEHPDFPKYLEALKVPEPTLQLTKEDEGSWWLTRGGWKAKVQTVGRMVEVIHDIPHREDEFAFHSLDGTHPCLLQYDLMERIKR